MEAEVDHQAMDMSEGAHWMEAARARAVPLPLNVPDRTASRSSPVVQALPAMAEVVAFLHFPQDHSMYSEYKAFFSCYHAQPA